MYVQRVRLKNIRSIKSLDWVLPRATSPPLPGKIEGWHVIIGDNGSGKSTFLRSIALALVGPLEAVALRQDWKDWLRTEDENGSIRLDLEYDPHIDRFKGSGTLVRKYFLPVRVDFDRLEDGDVTISKVSSRLDPMRSVWGGKPGWFSSAYGPFRRFTGGDKDYEKIFYSNPKLAAHLSVFGESVALTECLRWLQDLQFKKLENHPDGGLLDSVRDFVNQEGFLPHHARLHEISSKGVEFRDGNGCVLPVEELSDGYRSILSMTFELIRQLAHVYGAQNIFAPDAMTVTAPGVVLIDEVDAHLHPTWQRMVGLWFREHFPSLQFIVTTHSPLICQAADIGSVYRLPKPGSDEEGGMVTGTDLDRILYGSVLDAYSTEMFGPDISRSHHSMKLLQRLAELNSKELKGRLSQSEREEQSRLRAALPTSANTVNS